MAQGYKHHYTYLSAVCEEYRPAVLVSKSGQKRDSSCHRRYIAYKTGDEIVTEVKPPALVPVPPKLDALMRLVNLLPKSLRRSMGGIHELTMRLWNSDSEQEAITSWFYFWRYVNPLSIGLQAFVLHDDDGLHIETDYGMAPFFDPSHLQPYQNVDLPARSDDALREVVSKAKERITREIELVQEKANTKHKTGSPIPLDAQSDLAQIAGWPREYVARGSKFSEVGPRRLAERARQRFFFILAAEEILDALTADEPQKKLDTTWYVQDSGVLMGSLFVENDEVHLYPPILFSFVVGLQVSRIRKCGICGNYFWAGRKDKKVCSPQCGATNRKRKERKRYMEIKLGDRVPKRKSLKPSRAKQSVRPKRD